MAAFPNWVKIGFPQAEEAMSVVERTPMDRGVPKQRRTNSDARVEQDVTLYFNTKQQSIDWDTFFYTTIHAGQDWFDWPDSRTGATLQARIVGGNPGKLVPKTVNWVYSQRVIRIEWMRSAV